MGVLFKILYISYLLFKVKDLTFDQLGFNFSSNYFKYAKILLASQKNKLLLSVNSFLGKLCHKKCIISYNLKIQTVCTEESNMD